MAMRITRSNVESLMEALETLSELVDMRDDMETWLENQDEPKTEDVCEIIRESREAFQDRLDDLADACQQALGILKSPASLKAKKRTA